MLERYDELPPSSVARTTHRFKNHTSSSIHIQGLGQQRNTFWAELSEATCVRVETSNAMNMSLSLKLFAKSIFHWVQHATERMRKWVNFNIKGLTNYGKKDNKLKRQQRSSTPKSGRHT